MKFYVCLCTVSVAVCLCFGGCFSSLPTSEGSGSQNPSPPQKPSVDIENKEGVEAGVGTTVKTLPTELWVHKPASKVVAYQDSRREQEPTKELMCKVHNGNFVHYGDKILERKAPLPSTAKSGKKSAKRPKYPRYAKEIKARFGMSKAERKLYKAHGFYVAEGQFSHGSNYADALHEIFQSELPLYFSTDAVLHSVYLSHENLLEALEYHKLIGLLGAGLERLHTELVHHAEHYPDDVVSDLDFYLTVARRLLHSNKTIALQKAVHREGEVSTWIGKIKESKGLQTIALFGRQRTVDFTAYTPRGHYARDEQFQDYFRASMWLSRLEFNLVSRSCRSSNPTLDSKETPREALIALSLGDLMVRSKAKSAFVALDEVWSAMAGVREDASPMALHDMVTKANLGSLRAPDAFERFKAIVGDTFARTTISQFMPDGVDVNRLPAISTVLGPRLVVDAQAMTPIAHPVVPHRYRIYAGDVGYLLGHDRALRYIPDDTSPGSHLRKQLDTARHQVATTPVRNDLYSHWFDAIRKLSHRPEGATPSFMQTAAFDDLRFNTALVAYGQLRHNNVLYASETYSAAGCRMPDAYVEPTPKVYDALLAYFANTEKLFARLDPEDETGARRYFANASYIIRVLRRIIEIELANKPLPSEALSFMNQIVEMLPPDGETGDSPEYNGWYFDLFFTGPLKSSDCDGFCSSALDRAKFLASFHTAPEKNDAAYLGATSIQRGVFLIDTGGAPRLMVGPVTQGVTRHHTLDSPRLTDGDVAPFQTHAKANLHAFHAPWARSYTAPVRTFPLKARMKMDYSGGNQEVCQMVVLLQSTQKLRGLTLSLLDHHRRAIQSKKVNVGPSWSRVVFAYPQVEGCYAEKPSGLKIQRGDETITLIADMISADQPGPPSWGIGGLAPEEPWVDIEDEFFEKPKQQ